MKINLGALVAGAAVAALAGCGSSPTKSNAPATASAACVELHAALAARAVRCGGGAAADWAAYEAMWDDCAAYDRHVGEGKVLYVRAKFDACMAEYDLACDHVTNCFYEVLVGVIADGQHCQDTEVCGSNSACFAVTSATCGEVCVRAGVENETCGLYCGGTTPCPGLDFPICRYDLTCVNNVCVTPKAAGAACGGGDPIPCLFPAFCTADPADPQSTGTCKLPASGAACRTDTECPTTDFCQQGTCVVRRAAGAVCGDAPTGCAQWTTCDAAGGTCVTAGKPGYPCAPYQGQADVPYCLIGVCGTDGFCVGSAGTGESCAQTSCVTGSSCDATTLMCVACAS